MSISDIIRKSKCIVCKNGDFGLTLKNSFFYLPKLKIFLMESSFATKEKPKMEN